MTSLSSPAPASPSLAARGIALRPAVAADAPFLRDVYIAGRWEEWAAAGLPDAAIRPFLESQFALQTLHYDRYYADADHWIVQCRDVLAGRLILLNQSSDIRLVDIGLLPGFRGAGIGAALLGWVQTLASAAGHGRVSLHVAPTNPAQRLYHRMGFRVTADDGANLLMEWRAAGP